MSTQNSTSSTPNQKPKDLITMAISNSPEKAMEASDITNWISRNFPYCQKDIKRLHSSVVRSLNKHYCFSKLNPPIGQPGRKIFRWTKVPVSSQNSKSPKPNYTCENLIKMAFSDTRQKELMFRDIIGWISEHFPFYRREDNKFQEQVRNTLRRKKCFMGIKRPDGVHGFLWTVAHESYEPCDTIAVPAKPQELNKEQEVIKSQAAVVVGRSVHANINTYFGSNYSVYGITNSDGFKAQQNYNYSNPIQQPNYTYIELITMAISSSAEQMLPTCDILEWISKTFPFYQKDVQEWQDEVREVLPKYFYEFDLPTEFPKLGNLWAVIPTLEELSRLQKELVAEGTAMATEPIMEGALHQQPECLLYQQQQDEL